ncbi:hypothetical protein Scep_006129 [Stephania cephalantha]|uniref:Uncharacterized protein n=1 Tax=Stephania cephalantha TaxID=152367 RepID=A0AAP0K7K7_9MAGN
MDGVELSAPVGVVVPKILIGEGFGRQGGHGGEGGAQELKSGGSVCGRSASNRGSDSNGDAICAVPNLEQNSVSRAKSADLRFCKPDNSFAKFGGGDTSKQINIKSRNSSPSLSNCTAKSLHQKSGKASKSSSPRHKKQKAEAVEVSLSQAVAEDIHSVSGKYGSNLHAFIAEKSHGVGHKHGIDGKRGERRNSKAATKTKLDSFFPKAGSGFANSAAGGENILGIYGLRSDIHDVTKHVDEVSLNDLLDGSYKWCNQYPVRGKKAGNANENIVNLVRNACSILQPLRTVRQQSNIELESISNKKPDLRSILHPLRTGRQQSNIELESISSKKTGASLLNSGSSPISGTTSSKTDACVPDPASSCKDTGSICAASATSSPSLLCKPHDILERLSLPPVKDMDSLVCDTSKPMMSSKNTVDQLSSKSFSHGARLPPFSWSHCPSGLSKTIVDTSRFSASKSTSQGRWVRIGSIASPLGGSSNYSSDLEVLISDHEKAIKSLIPMVTQPSSEPKSLQGLHDSLHGKPKFGFTMGNSLQTPEAEGTLKPCEIDVASICSSFKEKEHTYTEKEKCKGRNIFGTASSWNPYSPSKSYIGESEGFQSHLHTAANPKQGYSSKLLVAAQTLYEMSRHSAAENKTRSFKRPPQRVHKPYKTGLMMVKEEQTPSKSEIGFSSLMTDPMISLKKLNLSTNNKRKVGRTSILGREPMKWSIPTSVRSSPCRTESSDVKHSNADNSKLLGMMPPSKRMFDRTYNNDQKVRKLMSTDWSRGRSRMD